MKNEEIKKLEIEHQIRLTITQARPDRLIRVAAGVYLFFHTPTRKHYWVEDDSNENGGQPEWVVREERSNNVANTYPTLKAMKGEWL